MGKGTIRAWSGAAVFSVVLSGCATLVNSPTQAVLITSDPPDATAVVDDRIRLQTPGKASISRQSSHTVVIRKAGYQPVKVELTRGASAWALLDVLCLPVLFYCLSHDLDAGGFYTFTDRLHVTLSKRDDSSGPSPP